MSIPEDVMKTAQAIANERFALGLNIDSIQDLAATIARALMAERERAARIADDIRQRKQDESVEAGRRPDRKRASAAQAHAAAVIAYIIRNA